MAAPSDAERRRWMAQWRSASVALARVRQEEVRDADLARIATDLEDVCVASASVRALATSSGLIDQQRSFHRLRDA